MAAQAGIHLAFVFAAVLLRCLAPRENAATFPPEARGEARRSVTLEWLSAAAETLAAVIHADRASFFYCDGRN